MQFTSEIIRHFAGSAAGTYCSKYTALLTEDMSERSIRLIEDDHWWGLTESFTNMPLTDGRLSCSLFAKCACPAVRGSFYREVHLRRMVQLAVRYNLELYIQLDCDKMRMLLATVQYKLTVSDASSDDLAQIKALSSTYANPRNNWVVDFEFHIVEGLSSIIWSVSLRRIDGKSVFYTTIDYGKSIPEIERQVRLHLRQEYNKRLTPSCKAGLTKATRHYRSNQTHGMTMTEAWQKILDLGYKPATHTVMSWYSTLGHVLFLRLQSNDNRVLVPRSHVPPPKHPIDVARLTKRVIRPSDTYALEVVTISLYPDPRLEFHHAADDTLAMVLVIRKTIALLP